MRNPVQAAAELAEGMLERSGITLTLDLPDRPAVASVDEDRVKRAILNLLRNAGEVSSDSITVVVGYHGSEIEIVVADNGPGIAEELRGRVFDPFFTDKERGAGLGLSIVKKVIESHGGRVEVGDSADYGFGSGAAFRLYFAGLEEPPPDHRILNGDL